MSSLKSDIDEIFMNVFETYVDGSFAFRRDNENEWDSVAHVSLVVSLESKFLISFSPMEYDQLRSFETVVSIISMHLGIDQ